MGIGDKWENDANDANGVVLYGADGSVIRRILTDSEGILKSSPVVRWGTGDGETSDLC